ncbi:MAG: hypothetical protein RIQ60_3776 [Pseudomonadota bacterium]|jgi:hypothetical protein
MTPIRPVTRTSSLRRLARGFTLDITSGITLGLTLGVSLLALAAPAQAAVQALLIAQGDYRDSPGVPSLQGPLNDLQLMKEVLSGRFKVPEANIAQLVDATHSQVEQAFAELTARVKQGDQVYVHYSGHGSWYDAPASAKGGRGQDQTWVTRGARSSKFKGKDAVDVLDKEVGSWLLKLHVITPDVVLVSDSCHSASMTRDVQVGVRSSDGVPDAHPLRDQFPDLIELPADQGLRIGAARDNESAIELDPLRNTRCTDARRCYGIFTWHWAQALHNSRPGESWGDVYDRTLAAIEAQPQVLQRAQKEGAADRAVFGGRYAPLTATVPVQAVQRNGEVLLGAGRLAGLTEGSELVGVVVQDEQAAPAVQGVQSAQVAQPPRLVVTGVAAASAQARLLQGQVQPGAQLKVSTYGDSEAAIQLHVGGPQVDGVDAALAGDIRRAIEQARATSLHNFELVDRREAAQWRLELVRPGNTDAAAASLPAHHNCTPPNCAAPQLWVVNPYGQLMHPKMRFALADPAVQIPRLLDNLAAYARAQALRAIARQGNATPLHVQVTVLRPPAGNTASCAAGARDGSGWQRLGPRPFALLRSDEVQLRDCLSFQIHNRGGQPWYGYLLSVAPDFRIDRVWPTARMNEDEARVDAGKGLTTTTFYRLSDPGRETLLFVAGDRQTPMPGLESAGLRGTPGHGALQRLSRLSSLGSLSRGVESADEVVDWGAQSITLELAGDGGARP